MVRITSSSFLFTLATPLLLVPLPQVHADLVTVFVPAPTDPALQIPSGDQAKVIGATSIGVASDGATIYAATQVFTALTLGTTTLAFSPSTIIGTFEEGASTYRETNQALTISVDGVPVVVTENIDCGPSNGNGDLLDCLVGEVVSMPNGAMEAATVERIASRLPIFTITGASAAATGAPGSGSSPGSAGAAPSGNGNGGGAPAPAATTGGSGSAAAPLASGKSGAVRGVIVGPFTAVLSLVVGVVSGMAGILVSENGTSTTLDKPTINYDELETLT
ncbi:hypothetical protein BDN70DRAFT_897877 [Pholiota conissans]|uniref:Uncharacterized protein n=1 Tax=Pholiota conissans TaxID=109636 RepID=A0A9P5YU29_9AGAR|nr:hypothetical protein BDN70DRAFT_897877 [Pholiota conissans]